MLMKREQISVPHLVVCDKPKVLLQKRFHCLKWPRAKLGKNRMPIEIGILHDQVSADPYILSINAKLLHDMYGGMIRIKGNHSPAIRQERLNHLDCFRGRGITLDQANAGVIESLGFPRQLNIDANYHGVLVHANQVKQRRQEQDRSTAKNPSLNNKPGREPKHELMIDLEGQTGIALSGNRDRSSYPNLKNDSTGDGKHPRLLRQQYLPGWLPWYISS